MSIAVIVILIEQYPSSAFYKPCTMTLLAALSAGTNTYGGPQDIHDANRT